MKKFEEPYAYLHQNRIRLLIRMNLVIVCVNLLTVTLNIIVLTSHLKGFCP